MQKLAEAAARVRANAYAPHSGFRVGAAILAADGSVFTGVNVENSSYGLTICAERTAVCTAVTAGARSFRAVAVASSGGHAPCGACRQFLSEFGDHLTVVLVDSDGRQESRQTTIGELLPNSFRLRGDG
ncbi:MAG: cytidine deaminase [Planctomycetota bacterium]